MNHVVELVPFGPEHLTPRYVAWLNDPAVVRFSEQRHRTHTLESCREFWDHVQAPDVGWAIVAPGHGHIGNITATVDERNSVANVAILIGERNLWGKGFGFEAWSAALGYLTGKRKIRKIEAGTMATNHGMLRIFAKSGMTLEGRRAGHFFCEGEHVDEVQAAFWR